MVTVHWLDDRWIEPQLRFIRRFLGEEHRVYASLNGIERSWYEHFYWAEDMPGSHPEKLNAIAERICSDSKRDDVLLFLDGDAFPIAPITRDVLDGKQLAAVRRDENLGQRQPHPCFCVTSVGFWSDLRGDWRRGHTWIASDGEPTTDVGGNLLGMLEQHGIEWRPLLRTNRVNLDPLWFAVYGDVVYHHGAGFRPPLAARLEAPSRAAVRSTVASAVIPSSVPVVGRLERSIRYRYATRREKRSLSRHVERDQQLSEEVFEWIRKDPDFFCRFTEAEGSS